MTRKILICCVFFLGGVMAGCSPKMRYELYRAEDPELNIALEYPAGWLVQEHKDEKAGYTNVLFIDNDTTKKFRPMIVVMVKKISSLKDPSMTPRAFGGAIVRTRMKMAPAKILEERKITIAGIPAVQTAVTYQAMERLHAAGDQTVPAKETMAVFKKDDVFYVLRFDAGLKDHALYEKAFRHAVRTLRFLH